MSEQNLDVPQIGEIMGFPLFQGTSASSIEKIMAAGHDVFFILGYETIEVKDSTNALKKVNRVGMSIVKKNLIGYSITPVKDTQFNINQKLETNMTMTLPRLPWQLVEKMDQFFRRVHELHGTEGIVVLTYDENYLNSENPSDGWGCMAPDQENTSGHCNYELNDDFMARKPENVSIVGSVHSHPEMGAFFSHTDHNDQADWDGLHITYAWKKGGPTEYHIELVAGGIEWSYKPEDVFAPAPRPELDLTDEIEDLVKHVSKKAYTPGPTTTHGTSRTGSTAGNYNPTTYSRPGKKQRPIQLPQGAPLPTNNTLISTIPDEAKDPTFSQKVTCLLCKLPIIQHSINVGRCFGCHSFLAFESETIEEFKNRYESVGGSKVAELDPVSAEKPIIFVFAQQDGSLRFGSDVRDSVAKK